jgi:hypothetical protein
VSEKPMSDRLMEAAREACGVERGESDILTDAFRKAADRSAIAVLRELARMDRTTKGGDAFLAADFDQLADEIEQR